MRDLQVLSLVMGGGGGREVGGGRLGEGGWEIDVFTHPLLNNEDFI